MDKEYTELYCIPQLIFFVVPFCKGCERKAGERRERHKGMKMIRERK
jgi:hypothetical protein